MTEFHTSKRLEESNGPEGKYKSIRLMVVKKKKVLYLTMAPSLGNAISLQLSFFCEYVTLVAFEYKCTCSVLLFPSHSNTSQHSHNILLWETVFHFQRLHFMGKPQTRERLVFHAYRERGCLVAMETRADWGH